MKEENISTLEASGTVTGKSYQTVKGMNRKQWLTLGCLSLGNIGLGACSSLQAPFFPKEAEMKGTTPAEYGLVFGLFYLSTFVFSPICGKMVRHVRPEFLRDCGMLIVGVCFILFGFLDKSPPGKTFLILAYVVRTAEGIGSSAFKTSNFVIIAVVFPERMAGAVGIIEAMFSLGLILGPSLGSSLYQLGGYMMPFVFSGSLLLAIGALTYFVLPSVDPDLHQDSNPTYIEFIKKPFVMNYVLQLIIAASCLGFNMVTLEPHLRQFNLSPISVGFIFVVAGASYGISSTFWGQLADKVKNPKVLAGVTSLMIAFCYTFIGPAPFLVFKANLWLICICLVVFGLGYGGIRVIAYIDCYKNFTPVGGSSDCGKAGIVSGVFNSAFAIGYFLGPTIGGIVFERIGYGLSTSLLAALMYIEGFAFLTAVIVGKCLKSKEVHIGDESCPLLQSHHDDIGRWKSTSYNVIFDCSKPNVLQRNISL